jgi:hypothetical protein
MGRSLAVYWRKDPSPVSKRARMRTKYFELPTTDVCTVRLMMINMIVYLPFSGRKKRSRCFACRIRFQFLRLGYVPDRSVLRKNCKLEIEKFIGIKSKLRLSVSYKWDWCLEEKSTR